jgi:hypothetical protein
MCLRTPQARLALLVGQGTPSVWLEMGVNKKELDVGSADALSHALVKERSPRTPVKPGGFNRPSK